MDYSRAEQHTTKGVAFEWAPVTSGVPQDHYRSNFTSLISGFPYKDCMAPSGAMKKI